MAAAATTLLALCALLAGAGADDHCTTKFYGLDSNMLVPLDTVKLAPGIKYWNITSPAVDTACDNPLHSCGVKVQACDPDGPPPPSVDVLSERVAVVTRNSEARSTGLVFITVYCVRHG